MDGLSSAGNGAISLLEDVGTAVFLATLKGFDNAGRFQILPADVVQPLIALSAVTLCPDDIGSPVLYTLDDRHDGVPLIISRLGQNSGAAKSHPDRLVLKAEREIELRCGDASIVLTRAGKVLIKGNFVLTRSRGANRIRGAYVEIN
jgi:hypothetical protein